MIKVNLIRNRAEDTAQAANVQINHSGDSPREAVVKIAFLILFTAGLMMYESQNMRGLQEEQMRSKAQVAKRLAEAAGKKADVEKVKDVEVQAKELEDKLRLLKFLSKLRLREVKTLDYMQSTIPEKVWLKSVVYESEKDHMGAGHFQITGHAVATDDLIEFVKKLEDSTFLMDVIVVKNVEIPVNKTANVRDFLFTAEVENNERR